ncbi:Late embryogenesis abundant protein [Heracleum sosnowskyi]|uniref:Late embryogenesis abundant protein n=1 Tax=Heracleum sosnowskyi TaxID=360622 RepID=A0AAD8MI19_9APIA|nr:Late embryogenesis abundant protein [Heracleum sosnowskyi]
MANTPITTQHARPGHSKLLRTIAIVILALIILVALAVLIIWLVIKPKRPVYTIEDGSIHGLNLTNDHLDANFYFAIRAYNPNKKVKIYNDKVEVSVLYNDIKVAYNSVSPFFQPHQNVTRLGVSLLARNAALHQEDSKDLILEKSSGQIEFEVKVKSRIRYRVGKWKSSRRTMKVTCKGVMLHTSSSKRFDRNYCDVDL